jgi:hypothetical protein
MMTIMETIGHWLFTKVIDGELSPLVADVPTSLCRLTAAPMPTAWTGCSIFAGRDMGIVVGGGIITFPTSGATLV